MIDGDAKISGHGLADGDVAGDHRAVHRRDDPGVAEVDLGAVQGGLALADGGLVEGAAFAGIAFVAVVGIVGRGK